MIFLGIESSCDETAVALIRNSTPLGHVLYSQNHQASGGVIPQVAAREHLSHLPRLVESLFSEAHLTPQEVNGIGVTSGPGLVGGLLIGIMWAKGLALALSKPLWPVHHLEAHSLMVRMTQDVPFPYLLLLLSGGHCLMAIAHGVGRFQMLGQTRDDAAGECLDKVIRALGGPYPGGPYLESQAQGGNPYAIPLPVPLLDQPGLDFSFSGLKTACLRWIEKNPWVKDPAYSSLKKDFCASFQNVIAQSLCDRLKRALTLTGLRRCVVSGGVAANVSIRACLSEVCRQSQAQLFSPPHALCTDNGLMIAWAAYEYAQAGFHPQEAFCVRPRWPLEELAKSPF